MIAEIQDTQLAKVENRKAAARTLLFAIPASDQKFFATKIPVKHQEEIRQMLAVLRCIHNSDNKLKACQRFSAALQKNGSKRGLSPTRLRSVYYDYTTRGKKKNGHLLFHAGDWRVLWNQAKAPAQRTALPELFIENVWRRLVGNHQRKCSSAYAELMDIWKTHYDWQGEHYPSIDGYDKWPEAEPITGHPAGWSEGNLAKYVQDNFDLTVERIGRSAAAAHRLKVYHTRVGEEFGRFFIFDDAELDLKLQFPGVQRVMRPRGFAAMELLSASCFANVWKPTFWDEDEEKKKTITETDMMWFVLAVLTGTGYRGDIGTRLCVEWGTAAIREWFEQRLSDTFHGKIGVDRSGKFGAEAKEMDSDKARSSRLRTDHQFDARMKGNFRFKALLESYFGLLHNYLSHLKGQVGKDRNHSPEQLYGSERYQAQLMKAQAMLPPEIARELISPFLTWQEFVGKSADAFTRIETNRRHEIEGFEKMNFVAKFFRTDEQSQNWFPVDHLNTLSEGDRSLILARVSENHLLRKTELMSRREVFQQHYRLLTKAPHYLLPALVGEEHCVKNVQSNDDTHAVREGIFQFENKDIDPDPLRFKAIDQYGDRLPNGERYKIFVNPLAPSVLIACDAKLKVVGICPRYDAVLRSDVAATAQKMGEARAWESKALARVSARHLPEATAKQAMHEHNAEKMSGSTLAEHTTQQRAEDRAAAEQRADAERVASVDVVAEQLKKNLPAQKPVNADDWLG